MSKKVNIDPRILDVYQEATGVGWKFLANLFRDEVPAMELEVEKTIVQLGANKPMALEIRYSSCVGLLSDLTRRRTVTYRIVG